MNIIKFELNAANIIDYLDLNSLAKRIPENWEVTYKNKRIYIESDEYGIMLDMFIQEDKTFRINDYLSNIAYNISGILAFRDKLIDLITIHDIMLND